MLSLLLDEPLSPVIAQQIRAKRPEIPILSMQQWEGGKYLSAQDAEFLPVAYEQKLTLVTYDQQKIVPLTKSWAEQGISHGGMILIDERTFLPNDYGGIIRSLLQLWDDQGHLDWENQVAYLHR